MFSKKLEGNYPECSCLPVHFNFNIRTREFKLQAITIDCVPTKSCEKQKLTMCSCASQALHARKWEEPTHPSHRRKALPDCWCLRIGFGFRSLPFREFVSGNWWLSQKNPVTLGDRTRTNASVSAHRIAWNVAPAAVHLAGWIVTLWLPYRLREALMELRIRAQLFASRCPANKPISRNRARAERP